MPCYPTALTLQVAIYNCESQVSPTTISWKSHSLGSCSGHTHAQSNGGKVQILLPWAPGLRLWRVTLRFGSASYLPTAVIREREKFSDTFSSTHSSSFYRKMRNCREECLCGQTGRGERRVHGGIRTNRTKLCIPIAIGIWTNNYRLRWKNSSEEEQGREEPSIQKVSAILYQLAVTWRYRRGHKKEYRPEEIRMCRRRMGGGMKKIREKYF